MADHARQQVRAAAVTDLIGLPITEDRVFTSRVAPLADDEMPGLKIALREESADWDTIGQTPTMLRSGRLIVEGWARGGDGLEDKLDAIAAAVEAKLYGETPALEQLLNNIGPPITSIDLPEPSEGTAKRTGVIRMLFPVVYRTETADPTNIL